MKIQESSQNYISCSWKSWFYLANGKKILVKVKAANSRFATKVHQRCLMGVLSTPPLGQWMKLVQNRHIQASLMVTLNSLKTLIKDLNYWLHVLHDWKSKKNFIKKRSSSFDFHWLYPAKFKQYFYKIFHSVSSALSVTAYYTAFYNY